MSAFRSWVLFVICILGVFGGCSAMAGGVSHWSPFLIWLAVVAPMKALNDRFRKVPRPIEFILWSIILLITINLLWLRYTP